MVKRPSLAIVTIWLSPSAPFLDLECDPHAVGDGCSVAQRNLSHAELKPRTNLNITESHLVFVAPGREL